MNPGQNHPTIHAPFFLSLGERGVEGGRLVVRWGALARTSIHLLWAVGELEAALSMACGFLVFGSRNLVLGNCGIDYLKIHLISLSEMLRIC